MQPISASAGLGLTELPSQRCCWRPRCISP